MKSILLGDKGQLAYVYTKACRERLRQSAGLSGEDVTFDEVKAAPEKYADTDFLFSTWGMPALTQEEIRTYFPRVKALFYAAGSVQPFARPFLSSGVRVFSAWQANAVPVAEFTVAQILLANKGYFRAVGMRDTASRAERLEVVRSYPGNYECRIGIIAAGQIGRLVIRALSQRNLQVLVYDPYITPVQAEALGARSASLETIFSECQTISNHLPNNAETRGMLNYALFSRMKPNATFINTGRGAQLVEADLIRALTEEPGRTALIDVTDPEVLPDGHPFYSLPNVLLTPHIAGSMQNEVHRMAQYMAEEFDRLQKGEPAFYEVSAAMLQTMA